MLYIIAALIALGVVFICREIRTMVWIARERERGITESLDELEDR